MELKGSSDLHFVCKCHCSKVGTEFYTATGCPGLYPTNYRLHCGPEGLTAAARDQQGQKAGPCGQGAATGCMMEPKGRTSRTAWVWVKVLH